MKKLFHSTIVLALLLPTAFAHAQQKMGDMKSMDMSKKPMTEAQTTHKATGIVKKVDANSGVVTIAHEHVNSMNWPPMTMGFMVKDKMLLAKLKAGKKVDFEFMQDSTGYVVTQVK